MIPNTFVYRKFIELKTHISKQVNAQIDHRKLRILSDVEPPYQFSINKV